MEDSQTASLKEVCIFLSDYASWLLGCGATCIRIEKNIKRMAKSLKVTAEMTVMPTNIQMSIWDLDHQESYSLIKQKQKLAISFNVNTRLSKLSWDLSDGKISFNESVLQFEDIKKTPQENKWAVLILASLANMSFCRLFGGDISAMLVVLTATLAGYRIKQILLEAKLDVRVVFFCSAFIASIIGSSAHLFHLGATPDIAIGTSVLYLIPGIPYINSVSDLLDGHYICAFSRFVDALVLTICLSMGLCCGMFLMGLQWLS